MKDVSSAESNYDLALESNALLTSSETVGRQRSYISMLIRICYAKAQLYTSAFKRDDRNLPLLKEALVLNDQALNEYLKFQARHPGRNSLYFSDLSAYNLLEQKLAIVFLLHESSDAVLDVKSLFTLAEQMKGQSLRQSMIEADAQQFGGLPQHLINMEYDLDVGITYHEKRLFEAKTTSNVVNDSLIDVHKSQLFRFQLQKDSLLEVFENDYPDYYQLKYSRSVVNIDEIQSMLDTDEALIEYFVGDTGVYAFSIKKYQADVIEIPIDFSLKKGVRELRESIYGYWITGSQSDEMYGLATDQYRETARLLHEKLIEPLGTGLPKKLIIIPDGILDYLPFETLLSETPKVGDQFGDYEYLLKEYQISYNYSATLWHELNKRESGKSRKSMLCYAPAFENDTAYVQDLVSLRNGLRNLKFNTEEAVAVNNIIGGDLYIGRDATEADFLTRADEYRIIHLSTHGKANDKMGDYSFIAFSEIADSTLDNERLYVRELYNMDIDADMVVLSACETGLGELRRGEGIIGLARGFTYAGARSTVTSLWSVDDAQTAKLMKRFYVYIKNGLDKDEALRQAKLDRIAEGVHADPYFWASFVAAGNMNPIDLTAPFKWWYAGLGILGIMLLGFGWRRIRSGNT